MGLLWFGSKGSVLSSTNIKAKWLTVSVIK
jgi:hypothetical protein